MHKFAILTLVGAALWATAFGLHHRAAIAWQDGESTAAPDEAQPQTQPEDAFDPATLNPPIDPAVAAEATSLLQQARDRLYAHKSVDAVLVERAAFGNRRFRAEGRYQAGPFPQLRLEYRIRVGQSEGVILEICDGQILRTSKYIQPVGSDPADIDPAQYQVSRKDVRQILQASDVAGDSPGAILQAELGIGGLPALLASLERTMEFENVQQQDYNDQAYFVLQGRWRQEFLASLDDDPFISMAVQQIAPFMPDRVRVYLDQQSLFPTRILYLKRVTLDPITYRAIMSIEFSDVKLNEGIGPETFRFSPPPEGVADFDETDAFIQMIEEHREMREAPAGETSGDAAGESAPQGPPGPTEG